MVLLSACSKVKQTKKQLAGDWEVVTYKYTNANGNSYYYDASTSVIYFDNCESDVCDYSMDIIYDNQGVIDTLSLSGSYQFSDKKGEYYDMTVDNSLQNDTIKDARIILITKDDLLTEYKYNDGLHTLVLKK